jgi:hypothetical protein
MSVTDVPRSKGSERCERCLDEPVSVQFGSLMIAHGGRTGRVDGPCGDAQRETLRTPPIHVATTPKFELKWTAATACRFSRRAEIGRFRRRARVNEGDSRFIEVGVPEMEEWTRSTQKSGKGRSERVNGAGWRRSDVHVFAPPSNERRNSVNSIGKCRDESGLGVVSPFRGGRNRNGPTPHASEGDEQCRPSEPAASLMGAMAQ